MRTYSTTGITVSPAELPDDVMTFAQAMAGEKAVSLEADRLRILHECAAEIEKEAGRLFWDGAGDTARRTESEIDLTTLPVMLPACPVYPDTSGADVTRVSVESWDYDTEAWATFAAEKYKRRPRGGIYIPRWAAGRIRVFAAVAARYRGYSARRYRPISSGGSTRAALCAASELSPWRERWWWMRMGGS